MHVAYTSTCRKNIGIQVYALSICSLLGRNIAHIMVLICRKEYILLLLPSTWMLYCDWYQPYNYMVYKLNIVFNNAFGLFSDFNELNITNIPSNLCTLWFGHI